jgi:hypothetical protein
LECNEGYQLNLETYQCELTCPETTVLIEFDGFRVCRPKHSYYVDQSSTLPFEFGTEEYPFKRIIHPFREIWNIRLQIPYYVGVYIKRNTTLVAYSTTEVVNILDMEDLEIAPYPYIDKDSFLEDDEQPIIIWNSTAPPTMEESQTSYSPWSMGAYMQSEDKQMRFDMGHISTMEMNYFCPKIAHYRANINFHHMRVREDLVSVSKSNSLFFGWYSPEHVLTITNVHCMQ